MRLVVSKIPAILLAALISLGCAPIAAHADDAAPSSDDLRGAMAQLLKLDELLNKDPQPMQHSTVGGDAPEAPAVPQVAAPTTPHVTPPHITPPQKAGVQAASQTNTAAQQPQDSQPAMPRPVNPGATGAPTGGRVNLSKPGKLADNSDGGANSGNGGGIKGMLPDFSEELTKPKPKSKIKRVSKPVPVKPVVDPDEASDQETGETGLPSPDDLPPVPRN